MPGEIEIAGRKIGEGHSVFIVAELSANHRQKLEVALDSIKAAKEAGADAVKIQTYTPDTMTLKSDKEHFRIRQGTVWDGRTLYDLYEEAYTPWTWHRELFDYARKLGLIQFSTAYDRRAVDFLESLDTPTHKVASFEITDIPLIEYMASKGKPIIISTGIATLEDINEAISACKRSGNNQIVLLKCVSEYPTPLEDVNLRTIPDMRERFGVLVGLSDHTTSISVPVAAVALGAVIIEKHFTLDRGLGGPDCAFSLEPEEFAQMVRAVREVEKAMGRVSYELTERQKRSRQFARSLFVVRDIKKGEILTEEKVRSIRPGCGLHPKYLKDVVGKKAKFDIEAGTPLSWDMIE